MKTTITPYENRVCVEIVRDDNVTPGGIIIPETAAKTAPQKGKVLKVGPGKFDNNGRIQPVVVTEGATVLFNKYAGCEIEHEGKKLKIVSEDEIIAVLS